MKLARIFLTEVNFKDSLYAYTAAGLIGSTEVSASASSLNIIPENQKVALHLFKQAAMSGLPDAMAQMGQIYEAGGYEDEKTCRFFPLVKRSLEKALPLFEKAA